MPQPFDGFRLPYLNTHISLKITSPLPQIALEWLLDQFFACVILFAYSPRSLENIATNSKAVVIRMGKPIPISPIQLRSTPDTLVARRCQRSSLCNRVMSCVPLASRNAPPIPNGRLRISQGSRLICDRPTPIAGRNPKQTISSASQVPKLVNRSFRTSSFIG